MGKKDKSIEDLYEVMSEILEEQRAIRKLLESKAGAAVSGEASSGSGRVFLSGKYKGRTPDQILDKDPGYIEFIYKTFIQQPHPKSGDWDMVTERHFNIALSRSSGGKAPPATSAPKIMEPDEEDAPAPSKKKKPVPVPPTSFDDDIPF